MTTVKFLNGTHSIDGNIVAFYTKTSRVIVDFGMVGGFKEDTPEHLMKSHILPKLPELFTNKDNKFEHQAIILTHLDLNNLTAAIYLKAEVDIYLSPDCLQLYNSLIKNGLLQPIATKIKPLPEVIQIGNLFIHRFSSDCGLTGASALLINDGKRRYGISGNMRLNGPQKESVQNWINCFREQRLSLFMFDSTAFSFSDHSPLFKISETDLLRQFADILRQRKSLIVVNLDDFNLERIANFAHLSEKYQRTLVFEEPNARVLRDFYPDLKLTILQESIVNKKTTSNDFEVVSIEDINQVPGRFVLQNCFGQIDLLKLLKNKGLYLHSDGFPKNSESRDFLDLREKIKRHGFQYLDFSGSYHASKSELRDLVQTINAKKSIPWHSYLPEVACQQLQDLPTKLLAPENGDKIHYK